MPSATHNTNVPAEAFHRELTTVHRALKRSLQRIVDTAPQVMPAEQKQFVQYCDHFIEFMYDHHHHEDDIIFPMLAGPCGVVNSVRQLENEHIDLNPLLHRFRAELLAGTYDGKAIARVGMGLQTAMLEHINAEEGVFTVEVLARASPELLNETMKALHVSVRKTNPFTQLPFMVNNLTKEEAQYMIFRSEPWVFRKVLYPLLFSRVHRRMWRQFASHPLPDRATA